LSFRLTQAGMVRLRVFDLRGRLVRTLTERGYAAGEVSILWDGKDDAGRRQAAGTYLVQLDSGDVTATRKLLLVH
jgi:flagellar hook assembly protein FlgD